MTRSVEVKSSMATARATFQATAARVFMEKHLVPRDSGAPLKSSAFFCAISAAAIQADLSRRAPHPSCANINI
jgi:hypothetical protein